MNLEDKALGIILCGGLSRRMGSDKSQKKVNNLKLIDIVVGLAINQVFKLALNASEQKTEKFNLELVPDCMSGNLGPLVGILSGLKWTKKQNFKWLMVFPIDSPFFPKNIVKVFFKNLKNEQVVMAKSSNRLHPVFSMWKVDLIEDLEFFLKKGERKIDLFTKKIKSRLVNFPVIGYDPFFNVNNEEDLRKAENIYSSFFQKQGD